MQRFLFIVTVIVMGGCKETQERRTRGSQPASQSANADCQNPSAGLLQSQLTCEPAGDFRCVFTTNSTSEATKTEKDVCFLSPDGNVCVPTYWQVTESSKASAECYHINLPTAVRERILGRGQTIAAAMAAAHAQCLQVKGRLKQ